MLSARVIPPRTRCGWNRPEGEPGSLDNMCYNTYIGTMVTRLQDEIRQTRPFESLEQEAFLSVGRTWAVLEHAFSEALRAWEITPTQYNVLRILRGAGTNGLCRAAVMERMIARVPDATRLLDRLEATDLITRERDSDDRRYVTTRITRAGLKLLDELDEPVQALHRRHLGALDSGELETLIALLGRVRATV